MSHENPLVRIRFRKLTLTYDDISDYSTVSSPRARNSKLHKIEIGFKHLLRMKGVAQIEYSPDA